MTIKNYSNSEDQSTIYGVPRAERLTMAEFAIKHFRQPKSSDLGSLTMGRRKKEWTWQEITDKVKFSDKPISHSLIRLANQEADKSAVEMFGCVMRYMSDLSMKRGQTITDCVYEILSICHNNPVLVDEAYCQVIKQTTSNKSPKTDSLLLGWRLFAILTAYFSASEVLQPYLLKYLRDIGGDPRRPFGGTANLCLMNYQQTIQYGGRKFILTAAEVEAITGGKNVKRQAYELPGGQRRFISTRTITVAEEIIKELCIEMNVLSEAEQHEFALCYILEKDNSLRVLSNDEYILDVTSELETKNEKFTFILTRTVWIHPLREDNKLYIDVLFFQLVPNYMTGLLTNLPKGLNSPLPAKILDDAAALAALLYTASEAPLDELTEKTVASLIPVTVFERSRLSTTNWVTRIKHKISVLPPSCNAETARSEFLKFIEKWPLYGSSFYFVTRCRLSEKTFNRPILAVNKNGLKILDCQSMDLIWSCPLSEVRSSRKYSVNNNGHLDVHIAPDVNSPKQTVLTVETDSGSEIGRVIGQYVYLSRHKPNLVVNTRGRAFRDKGIIFDVAYVSPALRCIQTAVGILKGMNCNKLKLNVEPGLFEWLQLCRNHMLPTWMTSEELLEAGYPVNMDYVPIYKPTDLNTSEGLNDYYERSHKVAKGVFDRTKSNTILFVAHGSSLDACTRLAVGGQPRNNNDFYDILQRTPYLSTIQLNEYEKKYEIAGSPIPPLKHSINNEYDHQVIHRYS
ncbi:hypothetical protein FO519_002911 [Halicephalobus sp. NKZ332]|nr:hypothetical protein FO519_002911 [Halicephalobus sp. NKZ332]